MLFNLFMVCCNSEKFICTVLLGKYCLRIVRDATGQQCEEFSATTRARKVSCTLEAQESRGCDQPRSVSYNLRVFAMLLQFLAITTIAIVLRDDMFIDAINDCQSSSCNRNDS